MERERNAATAGAGRWEAPDGVIVLPVGSAAPQQGRQKEHQYQQRKREMEREREQQDPGAREGVLGLDPQPPEKVYYKTRLCEKFEAGKCVYEGGCTFAHGSEELRPPLPLPLLTSLVRRKSPLPSSSQGAATVWAVPVPSFTFFIVITKCILNRDHPVHEMAGHKNARFNQGVACRHKFN